MMSHWERLARRAARRPGPFAERAWQQLSEACRAHDGLAVEAMWGMWLRQPAEDVWLVLQEGRRPKKLRKDALAAAMDPLREAESRAAIGRVLVGQGIAPGDEIKRTLFYALTGQREHQQALDPDGRLLAAAYLGADELVQKTLRQMMAGAGDLDLVRAIADRPDRVLSGPEIGYAARHLAEAGEWRRFWRLVSSSPVPQAVLAVRAADRWRPPDDAGWALFDRLAEADPDVFDSLLTTSPVTRIESDASLQEVSFSPDGAQVAMLGPKGIAVHDARTGRRLEWYPGEGRTDCLLLDDSVVICNDGPQTGYPVIRCTPDRPVEVLISDQPCIYLGRTSSGFLAAISWWAWYGASTGDAVQIKSIDTSQAATPYVTAFAVEQQSGLIGAHVRAHGLDGLAVLDHKLQIVAQTALDHHVRGGFCGPDLLVTWDLQTDTVNSYRAEDGVLHCVATVALGRYLLPVVLSGRGVVIMRRDSGGLMWLDASTLTEVEPPQGFTRRDPRKLFASDDGGHLAVVRDDGTDIHDMRLYDAIELAQKPLAQASPGDLRRLRAITPEGLAPDVWAAISLVRACFEYRFDTEIALGAAPGWHGGADDIALGSTPGLQADDIALGGNA